MNPEEVLAFVAQHVPGGAGKALYSKTQKQIENPLAGTPGHLADPEKITVTVEQWKTPDGQVIFEGYQDPAAGGYVALQQNTPKPATATAAEVKATAKGTTTEPVTGPGGNTSMVTWELESDGSKGRIIEQVPATKAQIDAINGPKAAAASKKTEVKPGVFHVVGKTVDAQGNSVEDDHYEDAQGNPVPMPSAPAAEPKWSPVYKNNKGEWIQSQTAPNGEVTATRPAPEDAIPADKSGKTYSTVKQDENTGQWHGLTADGWEAMQGGPGIKPEMPKTLIDLPNGRGKGQLVPDPENPDRWIAVPVSGTEKPSDTAVATPDLTQATMGKYTDLLKKQWDEKYVPLIAAGTMTKADALDQFTKVDRALAESKANEEIGVLSAQQNIRSQDVTQRGQSLTSVENQRTGLTSAFNQAQQSIKPADAGGYYPAMIAEMMKLYGQSQEQAGIPRGVPSQQPYTPQQAQVMGAPGPSPIVFNINTGGTASPTTPLAGVGAQMGMSGEPGAMPPPTTPEQLLDEMGSNSPTPEWNQAVERVREDLLRARQQGQAQPGREMTPSPPVGGGMRWSGGQLRAPGASAGPAGGGPVGQVGG